MKIKLYPKDLLETACATSFSAVSLETVPVILETVCPCSFLLVSFFVLFTVVLVVVTALLPEIALPLSSLTVTTSLPAGVGAGAAPPPPPPETGLFAALTSIVRSNAL